MEELVECGLMKWFDSLCTGQRKGKSTRYGGNFDIYFTATGMCCN